MKVDMFVLIKKNLDIIYLCISIIVTIICLFIDKALAVGVGESFAAIGVIVIELTMGKKRISLSLDERGSLIFYSSNATAFIITFDFILVVSIFKINFGINVLNVIMMVAFLSQYIGLIVNRRLN